MVSDSAAVFTSAAEILKSIWEKEQVINSLNSLQVDLKFIPARSPHFDRPLTYETDGINEYRSITPSH